MLVVHFFIFFVLTTLADGPAPQIEDRSPFLNKKAPQKTIAERIEETRPIFEKNLIPAFRQLGLPVKPDTITLLYIKDTKALHLYAGQNQQPKVWVKSYTVKAASGSSGPKLKEGDKQVPEGIYRIISLNPNSHFYLSLKLNYPNEFDKKQAQLEQRVQLGGDIMIHGYHTSRGCLAIGDEGISELFHLAATTDIKKWKVLLAPLDLRFQEKPKSVIQKWPWMDSLYDQLKKEMLNLNSAETNSAQ